MIFVRSLAHGNRSHPTFRYYNKKLICSHRPQLHQTRGLIERQWRPASPRASKETAYGASSSKYYDAVFCGGVMVLSTWLVYHAQQMKSGHSNKYHSPYLEPTVNGNMTKHPGHRTLLAEYGIFASDMESDAPPLSEAVMMLTGESYSWKPLSSSDSFRLLTVQPGTGDAINCNLREYSLSDPPSYDAISYCRTTVSGRNTVVCDGIDVHVSQSLYDALKAARELGEGRFWIDDLCISQNDVEERSQQVQSIGRIFRGAALVCIFLGEESDRTIGALQVVKRAVQTLTFSLQPEDLQVVLNLLEQPWFERLWVVQEVCHARDAVVMHGSHVIPWSYIVSLCRDFETLFLQSSLPTCQVAENITKVSCLDGIRQRFHDSDQGHFLFDLMIETSKFKASDPRDKIFALVGLAKDVTDADWEVQPDYASSVEDVYHRFALWSLAKRNDFRLLSFSHDPEVPATYTLPSWVPDFSLSDQLRMPPLLALGNEPPNPGRLMVLDTWEANYLFDSTERTSYVFQTPRQQWKCADGIDRPVRPAPKSWYMDRSVASELPEVGRIKFSGDNKIVHFVGIEADELESLSCPALTELSLDTARDILLLQSKSRKWDPIDAWRLCHFVEDSLSDGLEWIAECANMASQVDKKLPQNDTFVPHSTTDLAATLVCGRLLSGLPDSSLSQIQWLRNLGLDTLQAPLTSTRDTLTLSSSPRAHGLFVRDLNMNRHALFHALCNGELGNMAQPDYKTLLEKSLAPNLSRAWKQIYCAIVCWSQARRFGYSREGRLVNAPIGAQPGDKICIIFGGSVPLVLRRRDDGYYTLIGECYAHELMHGEALALKETSTSGKKAENYNIKSFALK